MQTIYEVYNSETSIPFLTELEAIDYIQGTNLGFQIREVENEMAQSSTFEQSFYRDVEFGKTLIEKFLLDNRSLEKAFTVQDNLMLLQKFSPIETLSRLGDIKTVLVIVESLEIDDIFTQERKDTFIQIISDYLN